MSKNKSGVFAVLVATIGLSSGCALDASDGHQGASVGSSAHDVGVAPQHECGGEQCITPSPCEGAKCAAPATGEAKAFDESDAIFGKR